MMCLAESKAFFFEKKKQKAFGTLSPEAETTCFVLLHRTETKVFWFFFSKKNCLLSYATRSSAR